MCAKNVVYQMVRTPLGLSVKKFSGTGEFIGELEAARSQLLWNKSPNGFEMGYGGSGPAQLALAILLDVTQDDKLSLSLMQQFKWAFVAAWRSDLAKINRLQVLGWVTDQILCVPTAKHSDN